MTNRLDNFDLVVDWEKAKIAEKEAKAYRLELEAQLVECDLAYYEIVTTSVLNTAKIREKLKRQIHLYLKAGTRKLFKLKI